MNRRATEARFAIDFVPWDLIPTWIPSKPGKCFTSTAIIPWGEGDTQEWETQLGPLHCIGLFIFTKCTAFYFQDLYPSNLKNRLKSYWRRNSDISLANHGKYSLCPACFIISGKQVLVTVFQKSTGVLYKALFRVTLRKVEYKPHLAEINSLYWMQQFCNYLPFTLILRGG